MKTPLNLVALALLALATTAARPARAEDYPNKVIRIISDSQQFCVFGRFRTILLCCETERSD